MSSKPDAISTSNDLGKTSMLVSSSLELPQSAPLIQRGAEFRAGHSVIYSIARRMPICAQANEVPKELAIPCIFLV